MKVPWPRIVAHYQDLAHCEPAFAGMLELSQYIAGSPLVDELYAWTTATDLCIARTNLPSPRADTYLRVSHNEDGSLEVRHVDTVAGGVRWQRNIMPNQIVSGFQLCLEQMRWSTGEASKVL